MIEDLAQSRMVLVIGRDDLTDILIKYASAILVHIGCEDLTWVGLDKEDYLMLTLINPDTIKKVFTSLEFTTGLERSPNIEQVTRSIAEEIKLRATVEDMKDLMRRWKQ